MMAKPNDSKANDGEAKLRRSQITAKPNDSEAKSHQSK
jgi:hypothetical protein